MSAASILSRFFEVVERQPRAAAVVEGGNRMTTYGELGARAVRVSQFLSERGIGRGDIVAIGLPKSADYIAVMLGIWRVGAAFLPFDKKLPRQRLLFMLDDAAVACVLIREEDRAAWTELGIAGVPINFADAMDVGAGGGTDIFPEDLAYIIYTSGTTGVPKGVLVAHRGLVNMLDAQIPVFDLRPGSRVLFYLSTSFDASISDVGTSLLSGATLVIEPDGFPASPAQLMSLIATRQVTHLDIPPSLLGVLPSKLAPPCLKTVVIGGEPCPISVVVQWATVVRLVNVYGPTEATVCVSLCICDGEWKRPLIGAPIANITFHLLDPEKGPAPVGTPAELYIGGVGLALGYQNLPELTAERFVDVNGDRLYRTGDRVVELSDGGIQFLGRVDRQIKIRGSLIAPEEIETRLIEHPGVREVAVVKRALGTRDTLVAVVVSEASQKELRAHAQQYLPHWMVPQRWEFLDGLPRGSTGKIDFGALQNAESPRIASGLVAPNAPEEHILVSIWERILGTAPVGITDDFFALGGDSLRVIEMVAAAEEQGLALTPGVVLGSPTIAEIVVELNGVSAASERMTASELRQDGLTDALWRDRLQRAARRGEEPPLGLCPNIFS